MQGKAPADGAHARTNPAAVIGITRASPFGPPVSYPASTQHRFSEDPRLVDKETGKVGAIAEALAKPTPRLSETGRLSTTQAYRILGMLMTGDA